MNKRKWLQILWSIFILIALLAGPLLSGCKEPASGETATYTYTAGVLGSPKTKNPFAALAVINLYDAGGLCQAYEPLLGWTNNYNTAIPLLAKSWEYKAATKTWTFHLDEKAKFSDGTQVTASDVKYSWDTALKITGDSTNVLITMVKSIAVVDTKTVTIELKDAFADFMINAHRIFIVPEHIWSKVGDPVQYANDNPVGSGPYFWTELVLNSHSIFTKNPDYWRGASKIDKVIIKVYGNAESQLMALRKGDIDAMDTMDTKSAVPALMMDPNMKVLFSSTNVTYYIALNHRIEPLNILAFRKAINTVIDRRTLIDIALNGYGIMPSQTLISPDMADYNSEAKWPYEFKTQAERIAMANALLDAIPGMTAKGTDGIRLYNGKRVSIEYSYDTSADIVNQSALIMSNLKDIGIEFKPTAEKFQTGFAKVYNHAGKAPLAWGAFYQWQLVFYANWNMPAPASLDQGGTWRAKLYGSEAAGWTNKIIQDDMTQEAIEMDPQKRTALHMKIQREFANDVPIICLYHKIRITVYRTDRFTGQLSNTGPYFNNIMTGQEISFAIAPLNSLNLTPITK